MARTVSDWAVAPGGAAFYASEDELPVTLEPGGSATFPVTFAPPAAGRSTATLRALDEAGLVVVEIFLAGTAVDSRITVEPDYLGFGTRPVDSRTSRTLTVKVEGEPIELTAATVEGGSEFRVGTQFPVVVGETLEVEVRYEPKAAGAHQGTLVLATNHPRSPELRVPLSGTGQVVGPCRVQAPSSLPFGLVPAGTTRRETLRVTNTGTGECRLENFRIEGTAEWFSLEPVAAPVYLVPGATFELGVLFTAPVDRFDVLRRSLSFNTNDSTRPRADVSLSGAALDGELLAVPDPVDFGAVPVGAAAFRQLELRNQGNTTLVVKNLALKMGSDRAFAIRVQPAFPATLVPGAGITAGLAFVPDSSTAARTSAVVEVQLEGSSEAFRVNLVGSVGPCQGDCHSPRAICPGTVVTEVTKTVRLTGTGLEPDKDSMTCAWALLSGPTGSRATVAPGGTCAIDFTADLVGDYQFELAITDPAGNRGTCVTQVRADPYSGLWLETIWDLDADIDLHLLHPSHHPGIDPFDAWSWAGTDGADCFYWTCRKGLASLSWPDSAGPEDDPSLDVDGQHFGPENIRIDVPNRTHPYWIGVHWLYNPLLHPAVQVTTNLYCGGVQAASETVTLQYREHAVLGRVDVNPDGTCVFTASGVRLSY